MTTQSMLMEDISSAQANGNVDLKKLWALGRRTLMVKDTEATGYRFSQGDEFVKEWQSFGPDARTGRYHFAHSGNAAYGAEQARFFWDNAKRLHRPGIDILTGDFETSGENGAESKGFNTTLARLAGSKSERWTYGGFFFLRDAFITADGTHWWGAGYGPRLDGTPPQWEHEGWIAWQFTDAAHVPGLPGGVDQSHLAEWGLPVHHPAHPVLHEGDRNENVKQLQRLLNAKLHLELPTNGLYSKAVAEAVAKVKRAHGWKPVGGGATAGHRIWRYLTS